MARKQKQTKARPTGERLQSAFDVLTSVMSCLVLLAILVGLVVGRRSMMREASRLRSTPVRLEFRWPPLAVPPGGVMHRALDGVPNTWLDIKSRRALEAMVLSQISDDPFDAESLRNAQAKLMETGWFANAARSRGSPDA